MATTQYTDFTAGCSALGARTDSAGTAATDLSAEELRTFHGIVIEGYLSSSSAFVVAADSPASMDVIIGSGTAKADEYVVAGDDDGQRPYIVTLNDATVTVTLDAAHASLARTDEIWLVVRDNAYDSGGLTLPRIGYRKGDAGGGAPGADSSWKAAVKLATVAVAAGASTIGSGDITDERATSNLNTVLSDALASRFADVAGDTFTGATTFEALTTFEDGIQGSLGTNTIAATAGQSSWPTGYSWQEVTTGASWPVTNGIAETYNFGNTIRTFQRFTSTASTQYIRGWDSSGGVWESWVRITADVDEVDGYTEVSSSTALTASYATVTSVSLSIPATWGSWKCFASATWQSSGNGEVHRSKLTIDGTDGMERLAHESGSSAAAWLSNAIIGRRTGMTTTGSRTVELKMHESVGTATSVREVALYVRAVRTS